MNSLSEKKIWVVISFQILSMYVHAMPHRLEAKSSDFSRKQSLVTITLAPHLVFAEGEMQRSHLLCGFLDDDDSAGLAKEKL